MTTWLSEPAPLLILASLLAAFSGVPLVVRLVPPSAGQRLATALMVLAALFGMGGAGSALIQSSNTSYELLWPFPFGPGLLTVDPLSAFFTLPILVIAACCSIYAVGYWPANDNPRSIRKLTFFFGILTAAMIWVVMAHSAGLFLFAWEIMALAAYFVLTTNDRDAAVREAGTLYLICTHIGTLALFALFALLKVTTGSCIFPTAGTLGTTSNLATPIFLLALFGFGIKAGIMPLHIWLPSAHANAPSHVSAIMSGVILKIGIYGLLRVLTFFGTFPLWWGTIILALGIISGIVGVVFAIGQHDLKRLLAYHSIENIGIIAMGIGVALIGITTGTAALTLLGMAGALLHVINHATFKALLFLGAGSVIHSLGTRDIDRMGGLLRLMPRTAFFFLIGAVAICGLPPLNGFVSEFLIYLGLFNGAIYVDGTGAAISALAVPGLALIGGLALACFVKVFGVVFLGVARSPEAERGHEAVLSMRVPMAVLAAICIIIGFIPLAIVPFLNAAVNSWSPSMADTSGLLTVVPLGWISVVAFVLCGSALGFYLLRLPSKDAGSSVTWGCGYLAPTARMQYSASSFAEMLISLFAGFLRPESHRPKVSSSFPLASRFSSHIPEAVLEKIYLPLLQWANAKLVTIRKLQHGQLHLYILYIFLTLVVLMVLP